MTTPISTKGLSLAFVALISSCKSVPGSEARLAGDPIRAGSQTDLVFLDVNDVSILVPRPEGKSAKG